MTKIILSFVLVICVLFFTFDFVKAQGAIDKRFVITQDSIGIVKIGEPLKQIEKQAKDSGFSIKQKELVYSLYDSSGNLVLTFTVFSKNASKKPIRTIETSNPSFLLDGGINIFEKSLNELSNEFGKPSIFKLKNNDQTDEIISFENWPFKESVVKGEYILKYTVKMDKVTDEYGQTYSAGLYSNDFNLYTEKYRPSARIKSVQIEAIEPQVKFNK